MAPPVRPGTVGHEIPDAFANADGVMAAGYIATQSKELKRLAMRARLTTLGYLIEMVEIEARETVEMERAR